MVPYEALSMFDERLQYDAYEIVLPVCLANCTRYAISSVYIDRCMSFCKIGFRDISYLIDLLVFCVH